MPTIMPDRPTFCVILLFVAQLPKFKSSFPSYPEMVSFNEEIHGSTLRFTAQMVKDSRKSLLVHPGQRSPIFDCSSSTTNKFQLYVQCHTSILMQPVWIWIWHSLVSQKTIMTAETITMTVPTIMETTMKATMTMRTAAEVTVVRITMTAKAAAEVTVVRITMTAKAAAEEVPDTGQELW